MIREFIWKLALDCMIEDWVHRVSNSPKDYWTGVCGANVNGYPFSVILTTGPSYSRDYWFRVLRSTTPNEVSEPVESSFFNFCLVFICIKFDCVSDNLPFRYFFRPFYLFFLSGVSPYLTKSPALIISSKSETFYSANVLRSGVGS